jgi:hypothetical protein
LANQSPLVPADSEHYTTELNFFTIYLEKADGEHAQQIAGMSLREQSNFTTGQRRNYTE